MIDPKPTASHFINGAYVEDTEGAAIDVIYPATGEVIGRVHSATPQIVQAALAAAKAAQSRGIGAAILSDAIEGEAREVGKVLAAIAREIAQRDRPVSKPVIVLSGGETTVTMGGGTAGEG